MSKTLIDEALADAEQLKELAVENAKRMLMETVIAPRIKQLVESQLLGESDEEEMDESQDEDDAVDESQVQEADSDEDDAEKVSESADEFELNQESLKALAPLLKAKPPVGDKLEVHVLSLGESVQRVCKAKPLARKTNGFSTQISELFSKIEDTYSYIHEHSTLDTRRKERLEEKLESYYADLNEQFKEISEMSKKNLFEAEDGAEMDLAADADADLSGGEMPAEEGEELVFKVKGLKDVDVDSLQVDVEVEGADDEESAEDSSTLDGAGDDMFADDGGLGGEEENPMEGLDLDGDTVLEIAESDLKTELARMSKRSLKESDADAGKKEVKGGKIPVDDFGGGKDDGDPWLDHDVTTADDAGLTMEGAEDDLDEADEVVEGEEAVEECDMEESQELATEAAKRTSMAERQIKAEKTRQVEAQKKIQAFKTEAQKCRGTTREAQLKKRAMVEMQRVKESQAKVAKLQKSLKEGVVNTPSVVKENKELRSRLAAVSLFSAKLLYANKLLQTEGLSKTQKERIIEALDEAQSLREAKTLYAKLSDSLKSGRKTVAEGARRAVGSGSRPVGQSSAAVLTEGADNSADVQVDRWATLAGLK